MKNYYDILGINPTAGKDEIKAAYRKLSVKFHPDKNNGEKFFEEMFKNINDANDILTDDLRRKEYDAKLKAFQEQKLKDDAELRRKEEELRHKQEELKRKEEELRRKAQEAAQENIKANENTYRQPEAETENKSTGGGFQSSWKKSKGTKESQKTTTQQDPHAPDYSEIIQTHKRKNAGALGRQFINIFGIVVLLGAAYLSYNYIEKERSKFNTGNTDTTAVDVEEVEQRKVKKVNRKSKKDAEGDSKNSPAVKDSSAGKNNVEPPKNEQQHIPDPTEKPIDPFADHP